MNFCKIVLTIFVTLFSAQAGIHQEKVVYRDEADTKLEGVLLYPEKISTPQPAVIVVHDWRGLTETTFQRGQMLAELGYVAFLADVYGQGIRPHTISQYGQLATQYKSDRALFRERLRAAFTEVKKHSQVKTDAIAAIGYCFGGTGVIEMARDGLPLRGVVSFHGGLDSAGEANGSKIKTKVVALCGADDPFEKAEDLRAFEQELKANQVDYQVVFYGHAMHAFTDAGVDSLHLSGAKYDAKADHRSWQYLQNFLIEIFEKS